MDTWVVLGQILLINLVLSGDNALVIAMASKDLPEIHRKRAVWIGTVGAVILRCILSFVAVLLLKIPFLQAGGALLLIWIALKLIMQNEQEELHLGRALTLWAAIQTILIADFVMSLDNVLAIAGLANGDLALIVIGILLSIPIVVWGSGMIARLLHKYPLLLYIGAGVLAYTAGEMLIQDVSVGLFLASWMPDAHHMLPLVIAGVVVLIGGLRTRRRTGT
ncbi:TerC family protein [Paenibacillus solani]|uniref:Tellurium resistance protein TerC n=1 Tax=Paenibacillus solani TaxID=1705565 RepID=A0A0M1P202_9BACL|nr:TerC family protein [Paenibacillus solani]KOR88402.1 hypothetical protein AM231_04045 [Paenibacillus solani]